MANAQRGEVEIELVGQTFTLTPSFAAIAAIEQRTGRGIYGLAGRWTRLDVGLAEAAIVVEECIKASGQTPPKDLGSVIRAHGIGKLVAPLIKLATNAIRGDEPESEMGEAAAAP